MDLTSYAELAVLLINSPDRLTGLDGLHALLREGRRYRPGCRITRSDLEALRDLREELIVVFEAAAGGEEQAVVDRLNSLLIQHPVQPQISGHDGERWHMHLTEGGRMADQQAADNESAAADVDQSECPIDRQRGNRDRSIGPQH